MVPGTYEHAERLARWSGGPGDPGHHHHPGEGGGGEWSAADQSSQGGQRLQVGGGGGSSFGGLLPILWHPCRRFSWLVTVPRLLIVSADCVIKLELWKRFKVTGTFYR